MPKPRKVLLPIILLLTLAVAFLIYPIYVIRPFRHQGATELGLALRVLQVRPWMEALLVLAAFICAIYAWRKQFRLWVRSTVSVLTLLVIASAALSRVNVYEKMFHPLDRPSFATGRKTNLDKGEQLIAIKLRGVARAYPIRVISYHHIVNDVVAGIPVVATY